MNMKMTKFLTLAVVLALGSSAKAGDITANYEASALPIALVETDSATAQTRQLDCAYRFDAYDAELMAIANKVGIPCKNEIELDFTKLTDDEKTAYDNAFAKYAPFFGMHADFVVKFDKPVKAETVQLSGNYGSWGWLTFDLLADKDAGQELRLLNDGSELQIRYSYYMILTRVARFLCGAKNLSPDNYGTTMTVELRLYVPTGYDPENVAGNQVEISNYEGETGDYIVIGRYAHTFADPKKTTVDEVQPSTSATFAVEIKNVEGETVEVTPAEQTAAQTLVTGIKGEIAGNAAITQVATKVSEAAPAGAVVEALKAAAGESAKPLITTETDIDHFIEIELTKAEVVTKPAVQGESAAKAEVSAIVYDVTPKATVTVTVNGQQVVVQAVIPNERIVNPITFRLPVPQNFTPNAIVKHAGDPDRLLRVQGDVQSGRYVELASSRFSLYSVLPTDIATSTVESTSVLAIKRRENVAAKVDVAIAVPWKGTDGQDITVANLVTTDSLHIAYGDQLMLWNGTGYYAWVWDGVSAWEPMTDSTTEVTAPDADSFRVKRGMAAWLKRKTEGAVIQVGQYNEGAITTTPQKGESLFHAKHTLLINPKSEATPLAKIVGSEGDAIVILTSPKKIRIERVGGKWGTTKNVFNPATFVTEKQFTEYTDPIPADTGFWYISAGGQPTIQW